MKIETKCLHEGYKPENGGPGVMPIVQSTTSRFDSTEKIASLFDMPTEYMYSVGISNRDAIFSVESNREVVD